ncbi:hypothetical protein F2Q70_00021284 [Brassica cretica]|uniref:Uncharacterized protein n=1 Tax=Brassica cretica TaxID=69181 RepID=A0A8S9GWA4_BRACR|nr:hypothetical protein F2Q70_00021284 [Brassica cretica]
MQHFLYTPLPLSPLPQHKRREIVKNGFDSDEFSVRNDQEPIRYDNGIRMNTSIEADRDPSQQTRKLDDDFVMLLGS